MEMEAVSVPGQRGRRWDVLGGVLAWVAITAMVLLLVVGRYFDQQVPDSQMARVAADSLLELQAKWLVGSTEILGGPKTDREREALLKQLDALNVGSMERRLRYVTIVGDVSGPAEAEHVLAELQEKVETLGIPVSEEQHVVFDALRANYSAIREGGETDAATEELLKERLGWFGRLAVTPRNDPDRASIAWPAVRFAMTGFALISLVVVMGLGGVAGAVVLLTLKVLAYNNRQDPKFGLTPGAGRESVYAEIFAVWMALFLALGWAAHELLGPYVSEESLMPAAAGFMLSLTALAWGPIRGVPFGQVRRDIGWVGGRWGVLEPAAGVAGYAMSLPMLAIGLVLMFLLAYATGAVELFQGGSQEQFQDVEGPAHPIVGSASSGDFWAFLQIYLLASVCAPIVEETVFRGALYRSLRGATGRMGGWLSVILSGGVSSFIFAAIHPQGVIAIPVLMSLAMGFALIREWRNSLIPSMVAHGLSNGLVVTMLASAAG
jgi:membrane protease YdiL (CAAX protease family)